MGSLQGMYNFLGKSFGRGTATGGTKTTLLDTKKVFEDDMLNGTVIRMNIGGIDYYRTVTDTTASSSTITFATLPGTPASCVWTVVAGHAITTVSVADGGNDYTITAALAVGNNKPLAVTLVGNVITIALATGAAGASNDVANTAVLVAAAINGLAEFTSSVTTGDGSGVVPATASVAFTGGVDEVKPELGTHYEIAKNDGLSGTKLSGSNTRKWATDTITFGAGAGAHNAGEIMSTDTGEILEFDVSAWIAAGGSGIILSSLVTLNQAPFANQAGYTLHLFTAAPTVIADDAAWVLVAAELATYIGPIEISVLKTGTNASAVLDIGHNLDFTLASGSTKLYGQLVCKGTDTTVNTKIMAVNLGIAAL